MVDRGKLTGSRDDLQPAEGAYPEAQLRAGHDVEVVRTGARRTPDFKIDGQLIELKTISGIKDQSVRGISNTNRR